VLSSSLPGVLGGGSFGSGGFDQDLEGLLGLGAVPGVVVIGLMFRLSGRIIALALNAQGCRR